MNNHTLKQVIDLAVKTAVLQAKKEAILECRPIGSYFITETDDDPNVIFGGGWKRVKGKILQCSDDKHPAGTDIEAGLPNITGGFSRQVNNSYMGNNGAFYIIESGQQSSGQYSGTGYPSGVGFDASRSNSIYGRSDTVQPPTHVVNAWIRIS